MPILNNTSRPKTSRRTFLKKSGLSLTGMVLAGSSLADRSSTAAIHIGCGEHSYELQENWGRSLPSNIDLGMGAGVVVDSRDNVYALGCGGSGVVIFDRHGRFLISWGSEFSASAHGLHISAEGRNEFLYITETGRGCITKTTLAGKHILSIGRGAATSEFQLEQPAAAAVAPNGDIYICEGYGAQRLLRFNRFGEFLQGIGQLGDKEGQFNICHGITVDSRHDEVEIYAADRENTRIQIFTPDLKWKRTLKEGLRLPSASWLKQDLLFVADQEMGISIYDKNDQLIQTLRNNRNQAKSDDSAAFKLPHAAAVDSYGDMYVIEWVHGGRLRKFRHLPQTI